MRQTQAASRLDQNILLHSKTVKDKRSHTAQNQVTEAKSQQAVNFYWLRE